jgi:hypothetical protein
MAKLYPLSLAEHSHIPDSEKQVFEKLKNLDDTFHVFHSLTWNSGMDGECDFVIFNELRGFIALEVKGGKIDFDGKVWKSTDTRGITHTIKNPVDQARSSMYALKSLYEKKFSSAIPGVYTWGVCFFDGIWDNLSTTLDLSRKNVIDVNTIEDPQAWLENLFKEKETGHGRKILSHSDKTNFLSLFSRSLSIPMSIARIIEEQEKRLSLTDTCQEYLLDLFEDKNRIAFQGAAGTGKTWIAMKKSERLAGSGKRVLFLCYNNTLCAFIKEKLSSSENTDVMTFHSFAMALLRDFITGEIKESRQADHFLKLIGEIVNTASPQNKDQDREPSDKTLEDKVRGATGIFMSLPFHPEYKVLVKKYENLLHSSLLDTVSLLLPCEDNTGDFYSERLPLAVETAFTAGSNEIEKYSYDAVIVDEGQDFHKNWCDILKMIFDKYRNRIVYIFYDDNQTIFTGSKSLPITSLIANSGLGNHLFRLRDNLRNTGVIHGFAVNETGLGSTAKGADIDGVPPEVKSYTSAKEAAEYTGSLLSSLIEDHCIDKGKIIVLSNRNIENSIFAENKKAGDFTLVASGEGKRANALRYRTVHQFKGLESNVVLLVIHNRAQEQEEPDRYLSRELLYVGYTRAKHLLYVVNIEGKYRPGKLK